MLQALGISAQAEAVYVALGPLPSASVVDLARLTSLTPETVVDTLEELRKLGLATDSSRGNWRALPLLDVINQLKAQRLSEIELASVAAESLESHLLAAGANQADDIKTLVGRQTIVAAHRELMDSARREICFFDKPPYAQARSTITEEALSIEPEWQALERNGMGSLFAHYTERDDEGGGILRHWRERPPLTLTPSPFRRRMGRGNEPATSHAANLRSLMASKSCTPPPTRLVV